MARPKLPWRSPLHFLPVDGTQVWIRRLPWYDRPVLAVYTSPGQFHVLTPVYPGGAVTIETVLLVPQVHTWKFRLQEDEDTAFPPT